MIPKYFPQRPRPKCTEDASHQLFTQPKNQTPKTSSTNSRSFSSPFFKTLTSSSLFLSPPSAMDAQSQASSLLSNLETYNFTSIHSLFISFLEPFSLFTSSPPQNPTKKPSRTKKPSSSSSSSSTSIRSLAKTFLPFVNKCLSLIPKRLSESPKHPKTAEFATQLLDCYKLCLDCLEVMAVELSGKPYCVHLQRDRYVHCLMRWEKYEDAINEGFRVLKDLGAVKLGSGLKFSLGKFVPRVEDGEGSAEVEGDFVQLIVDLVVVVVQCVSLSKVKDSHKYGDLRVLFREVRPWFRHMEASARSKLQWKLLTHLKNITNFLVREATYFGGDLVPKFCADTFDEYTQLLNAQSVQGTTWEELGEYVKFVSNCTYKCRSACKDVRVSIAKHLYESARKFSQELENIQRLYALGLYFFELRLEPNSHLSSALKSSAPVGFLPQDWEKLQAISALLRYKNYYKSNSEVCDEPQSRAFQDFDQQKSLCFRSDSKTLKLSKLINGEEYLSFYVDALKFLCWPLAEFVTSERKRIVTEDMESPLGDALKLIMEAFLEYSYLFSDCQQNRESHVEIDMIMLSISMAVFILSLKLNLSSKGSTLVNYILSDECIFLLDPHMLKYIIAMLHNNFVEFYKHEQLNEASEALEKCCTASWSRCLLLSEILVGKKKGCDGELSENVIAEYVNEACKLNSLLMDIFHQIDSCKVVKVAESGLKKWCLIRKLLGQLPCPVVLMKHWAKMQCKLYKKTESNAPVLSNILLTIKNISTDIVGTVLEQELSVYREMSNNYPVFCQRMQMEIIDILLDKVYHSRRCIQSSIILVKKGMLSRNSGIGGLENCIHCLSDAIESIKDSSGVTHGIPAKVSNNQLAVVYCLRALSTHEAHPNSKEMFGDIRIAVNLWSRPEETGCSAIGNFDMGCDYVLLLLYHVADLLSIKGEMSLHSDVVNVIIKLYNQMNVPLNKCLLLLWESRRINHALCAVPVNEAFIKALSEHYGEDAESIESLDFWISSLKDSQPLLAGLQQNFSFLSSLFPIAFQLKHPLQSEISVDEVKEVAFNLMSNASFTPSSAFLAGYIYYDLSERLIVIGRTIEALLCAKEAHRLRGKLLQEHFSFSFQQHEESNEELGEPMRKPSACVSQFSVLNQVAFRHWPSDNISQDSEGFFLTPWNVLRCYLESTLQVGIVHERLGNVAEAEAHFILGKSISCLQSLAQFIVSFSSCLGKVYYGMSLFDLAQKELETSMQHLAAERDILTCSRCRLVLESCINEQLGNLYRNGVNCGSGNPYESSLLSLISLGKGDLAVWLGGASSAYCTFEDESSISAESGNRMNHDCAVAFSVINSLSRTAKTKAKAESKRSRKTKKDLESLVTAKSCTAEQNSIVTRSRKLSNRDSNSGFVKRVQNVTISSSDGPLESEATLACNKITCQKCFFNELKFGGSFTSFIQMKWEFVRRQHVLRLLIGLGKCQGALAGTAKLHIIHAKCIYILMGGNDCHCSSSNLLELGRIGKEIPGDVFAFERAELLYDLSWFSWKAVYSEDNRSICELCCIQTSDIVSFLTLSFVLSREFPVLFQKVARLLALIYVVSASREHLPSLSHSKGLSENYWAAYFHQASIGTHHNLQILSAISLKHSSPMISEYKSYEAAVGTRMIEDTWTYLRMVPESTEEIEAYVSKFFENLPNSTIVCMSLLGPSYAGLLEELMCYPSGVLGCILLSHLNTDSQPAVLLLPLSTVIQDEETCSSHSLFGGKNVQKDWCSPWGCNTLVDDVAPLFKWILRENYLSCSSSTEENTERSREVWWTCRDNLDKRLHKLLREMEEKWFGQWKYLLLGRWLDADSLNCAVKEFMHEREKDECKWDLNASILKIVMGGIKSVDMKKAKIPKLFLEKGCYIGSFVDFDRERSNTLDKAYDAVDHLSDSLIAAVYKVELEYCTRREPVVFVLDSDVQMLPFENMPIMREQEVYRMPSVASIFVALQRRSVLEEAAKVAAKFPLIDPLDVYYLLNPSGDLSRTQTEFEEWFKHQNMQGKAGVVPSTEELRAALESRDLFLYFGHGSGAQYFPREKIQKLESCAAVLLMGCSSGSLNLNGCYAPVGASLSYMLAGAPIVVANLWEVTDLDIDRFAKAVLKSFLEERSMSSTGCIQCSLLAEELKSMTVKEKKGNTKKGRGKKKTVDPVPDDVSEYCFRHKLRAGYFVSQARKACKLPFLIGAAPVCYGVPTGIRKKRDI